MHWSPQQGAVQHAIKQEGDSRGQQGGEAGHPNFMSALGEAGAAAAALHGKGGKGKGKGKGKGGKDMAALMAGGHPPGGGYIKPEVVSEAFAFQLGYLPQHYIYTAGCGSGLQSPKSHEHALSVIA